MDYKELYEATKKDRDYWYKVARISMCLAGSMFGSIISRLMVGLLP